MTPTNNKARRAPGSVEQLQMTTDGVILAQPAQKIGNSDLAEARRLFHAGFKLCKLKHMLKQPDGGNAWNRNPVTSFDENATGYGLLLAENGLCSIDPDRVEDSRRILAAFGFDLDEVMAAGVRSVSTRPNSGGRSTFKSDPALGWVKFNVKGLGTILELRAASDNLQDVIPGLLYKDRSGAVRTQHYANGRRIDRDMPTLPPKFLAWWQRLSSDLKFRQEQQRRAAEVLRGYYPSAKPQVSVSNGRELAFPSDCRVEFNAAHDVADLLSAHGYERDGSDRFRAPDSEGAAGIRLIPGKQDLWQSDHGSDPLNGTFDAWTAYVVLEHGYSVEAAENAFRAQQRAQVEAAFAAALDAPDETPPQTPKASQRYHFDLSRLKPVEFVIDGFIRNGLTVIAGAPGVGKTSLLVPLAAAVGHLYQCDLTPVLRRKVAYFSEAPEQVEAVLYGLTKHGAGVRVEDFRDWFYLLNSQRVTPDKLAATIRKAVEVLTVEQNGYQVAPLIVLDTSNANIDLDNENDNAEVGKAIAAIKENLGNGACWLVHHTAKAQKRADVDDLTARGAGAFAGDANATAFVFQEESIPDKRFMKIDKHRFEARFHELEFTTSTAVEAVQTPWGEVQEVRYRVGIPARSETHQRINEREQRKAERDAEREFARTYEITKKIREVLTEHGPLQKTQIRERVAAKAETVGSAIESMLANLEIIDCGAGRGGGRLLGLNTALSYLPEPEARAA